MTCSARTRPRSSSTQYASSSALTGAAYRLIAGCSSAGGLDAIDAQIERFRVFEKAGLTELSIRLFDDPMEGLELVARPRWPLAAARLDILTARERRRQPHHVE